MKRANARPSSSLVNAGLVLVAFLWGVTFVLVKEALADVSTLLFLALRFAIAATALALIFWAQLHGWRKQTLQVGALAGVCLFSGYILQTFGLRYTTASRTGFLTGLYIPLVPLLGAVAYRRAPRAMEAIGAAAAFAGMAVMTAGGTGGGIGKGDWLVAGCAVAYAVHILVLGHFARDMNVPQLIVVQIATGAFLGAATCWWAETPRIILSPKVLVALGVTSLLATALAFSMQTWAQQYSTPTRTALIFALEPVFAWLTSFVVLKEPLTVRFGLGAGLILAGIVLVEVKSPERVTVLE